MRFVGEVTARAASISEINQVFMMGFDVWGGNCSEHEYLELCRNSQKYEQGTWYVLSRENELVSSLIEYQNCWGLDAGY